MTPLEKQIAIAKLDESEPGLDYYKYDNLLPVLAKMNEEEWDRFDQFAVELWNIQPIGGRGKYFTQWLLTQPPSVLADIYLKVKNIL